MAKRSWLGLSPNLVLNSILNVPNTTWEDGETFSV